MTDDCIYIGQPYVVEMPHGCRLIADVRYSKESVQVWFDVDKKYGKYLCFERSDAFLIGMLNFAMRKHCDLKCEAPVGAQLLYQIREYMIPMLSKYGHDMYASKIDAPVDDSPMTNAGAIGAGISCGVDSLNVVKNCSEEQFGSLKLTHLVINNVGAFNFNREQYEWQANHAREFCREYGFELIETDSNFAEAIPQNHFLTHTYSSCFAIYCLQKLWSVYYYGSAGIDFQEAFTLIDNEFDDAARYELLSFYAFSTSTLKLYSEGGAYSRFDKLRNIIDYAPAQKYLHVCNSQSGGNCNVCNKCLRTLTSLDALGALEKFANVFDVDDYLVHRRDRLKWLYLQQILKTGDHITRPAYELLQNEISIGMRLSVLMGGKNVRSKARSLVNATKIFAIKLFPGPYRWYRKHVRHYEN